MDNIANRLNQLITSINALTDSIENAISIDQLEKLESMLTDRHQLLCELMAMHLTHIETEDLHAYLSTLRQRDDIIMKDLKGKSTDIKNNLSGLGKVKLYGVA